MRFLFTLSLSHVVVVFVCFIFSSGLGLVFLTQNRYNAHHPGMYHRTTDHYHYHPTIKNITNQDSKALILPGNYQALLAMTSSMLGEQAARNVVSLLRDKCYHVLYKAVAGSELKRTAKFVYEISNWCIPINAHSVRGGGVMHPFGLWVNKSGNTSSGNKLTSYPLDTAGSTSFQATSFPKSCVNHVPPVVHPCECIGVFHHVAYVHPFLLDDLSSRHYNNKILHVLFRMYGTMNFLRSLPTHERSSMLFILFLNNLDVDPSMQDLYVQFASPMFDGRMISLGGGSTTQSTRMCFEKVYIGWSSLDMYAPANGGWHTKPRRGAISEFRELFLKYHGIDRRPSIVRTRQHIIHITIFNRKSSRQFLNLKEFVQIVEVAFSHDIVRVIEDVEALELKHQIQLLAKTDLLLGMADPALSGLVAFMPKGSVFVQVFSFRMDVDELGLIARASMEAAGGQYINYVASAQNSVVVEKGPKDRMTDNVKLENVHALNALSEGAQLV
eukprot:PhF_6_TR34202/c0_g1_i1/m.50128